MASPSVSVICPLYDEEMNVEPLVSSVREALGREADWELILVDDGSDDGTAAAAMREAADPRVRALRLARNYGQSTATQAGFDAARGDVVVTMDGDLQNDPRDIGTLVAKLDEGFDLVVGYRERRQDTLVTRKIPSRVANIIIGAVTGVPIRDNGCSLKAYRRELVERLGLYSDMHRFIPALAVGISGARIAQVPVRHHERAWGVSKYGLSRVWKVLADLMTVVMLRWFRERPLKMFALGGAVGLVAAAAFLAADMISPIAPQTGERSIVFAGSALLLVGLALYLFMVGIIAEVAVLRWASDAPDAPRGAGA